MKTQHTFMIISRSVLLRVRNVSDRVLEKIKTHLTFDNIFFFENRVVYEIMWKNYGRGRQTTDGNMAYAHCMLDT